MTPEQYVLYCRAYVLADCPLEASKLLTESPHDCYAVTRGVWDARQGRATKRFGTPDAPETTPA